MSMGIKVDQNLQALLVALETPVERAERKFSADEKRNIQGIAEAIIGDLGRSHTLSSFESITKIQIRFEHIQVAGLLDGFWNTHKTEGLILSVLDRVHDKTSQRKVEELDAILQVYEEGLRSGAWSADHPFPEVTQKRIRELSAQILSRAGEDALTTSDRAALIAMQTKLELQPAFLDAGGLAEETKESIRSVRNLRPVQTLLQQKVEELDTTLQICAGGLRSGAWSAERLLPEVTQNRIQELSAQILSRAGEDALTTSDRAALIKIQTKLEDWSDLLDAGGLAEETKESIRSVRDLRPAQTLLQKVEELDTTLQVCAGLFPSLATQNRIQELSQSIVDEYSSLGENVVICDSIRDNFERDRDLWKEDVLGDVDLAVRYLSRDFVDTNLVSSIGKYNAAVGRPGNILADCAIDIWKQCLEIEMQERLHPSTDDERNYLQEDLTRLGVRCSKEVRYTIARIAKVLQGKTLDSPLSLKLKDVTLLIIGNKIIVKDRYGKPRGSIKKESKRWKEHGDSSARLGEGSFNRVYRAFSIHLADLSVTRIGLQRPVRRPTNREEAATAEATIALHKHLRDTYSSVPLVTVDFHQASRVGSSKAEDRIEYKAGHCYGLVPIHSGDGIKALDSIIKQSKTDPVKAQKNAVRLIKGIFEAYKLLAAQGLMHVDIKPENILVDSDAEGNIEKVWISDVDTIRKQQFIHYRDITAWFYQMSPEVLAQLDKHHAVIHDLRTYSKGQRESYGKEDNFGQFIIKNDDMSRYLKQFPAAKLTIRHLLGGSGSETSAEGRALKGYAHKGGYVPLAFAGGALGAFTEGVRGDTVIESSVDIERFHVKMDPRSEAFSVGFMLIGKCMSRLVRGGVFRGDDPLCELVTGILYGSQAPVGGRGKMWGGLLDENPSTRITLARAEELFLAGVPESLKDDPTPSSSSSP